MSAPEPYWTDGQVTLYLGDCREVLPALGVTADCIVADPTQMEGRVFGRLMVIKRAGPAAGAKTRWLCRCKCGTEKVVRGDHLRGNLTRSCGCLSADTRRQRPKLEIPELPCSCCGTPEKRLRHGWCSRCYQRWLKAGRPEGGPPPLQMPLDAWRRLPAPELVREVSDLAAGTAGEHVVCADLLLGGFNAFRTDQTCAYDVAVDLGGHLIRVQVKSTRKAHAIPQRQVPATAYRWHVRRAGKGARRRYEENAFDLYALVALDVRRVAYMPPSHTQSVVDIKPLGVPGGKQFNDYPFARALMGIGMLP